MNLSLTGSNAGKATVVGVEKINVTTKSFGEVTFDAGGVTGAGTVITVANSQVGGTVNATVWNPASGATVVAGAGVTGAFGVGLGVDAAGVQVNGGGATAVNVWDITDKGVSITAGASTTGISLQAKAPVAPAVAGTTEKATVSAVGNISLSNGPTTNIVENLTLSGNGAAVTYTLADALVAANTLKTVAFAGDQNVTLNASAVALAGQTVTDTTTGASATKVIVSGTYDTLHNLDKIAADQIQLSSLSAGSLFNVANNANVVVGLNANGSGTGFMDSTSGGILTLNSIKVGNVQTAETLNLRVASDQSGNALNVEDFETVNLTVDDGKATKGTIIIENLAASGVATGVVNVSGGDNLTLGTATAAKRLDASNLTGNLTATLGAGLVDIKSGAGNDAFNITTSAVDFKVDGGAGVNTLKFDGAAHVYTANTVSLANVGLVEITTGAATTVAFKSSVVDGKAFVLKGAVAAGVGIDTLSLTMDATSVDLSGIVVDAATAKVTVLTQNVATTITGSQGADTVSHAGNSTSLTFTSTAGNDVITGGSAADTITTGSGNDIIVGGDGNDTISAGAGDDNITGGAGADTITIGAGVNTVVYLGTTTALLTAEGNDTITDFTAATAQLSFATLVGTTGFAMGTAAAAGETLITSVAGLSNVNFVSNATGVSASAEATFAYNTATGALSFDADGTGTGAAAITIVTLTGAPTITAADFVIA